MNILKIRRLHWIYLCVVLAIVFLAFSRQAEALTDIPATDSSRQQSIATIAVLSHTDFLPDAAGVYDRRSVYGRDKNPGFVANNDLRTGSDQSYDHVERKHGYDPEAVGLPEVLADAILEKLTNSKRFTPVDRKALRTAVLEQRFGSELSKSYMDRTLDKAIQDMDKFEIGGGLVMPATAAGAEYNDMLHDFKDLGSAAGARYLVLGNLHQLGSSMESQKVPLSTQGRTVTAKTSEARLRLRVIDTASSTVIGADSLHLKVSSMLFEGGKESKDDFQFMEKVSDEAANKILDMVFPAKIISTQPLILSRGSNDGVSAGDKFTIIREGQEIRETSGVVIARLKQSIGKVRAVDVQETVSIVEPVEGNTFADGDLAVREAQDKVAVQTQSAVPLKPATDNPSKTLPKVAIGLVKAGSTAMTCQNCEQNVAVFTDTIISRLVQSKRFTVVDRQEVDQFLDEQTAQAIVENRELPSAMGVLKGCDYLLLGAIQNFSIEKQTITLPHSSQVMSTLDGFVEGNMRMVDSRSGEIMESRKISVRKQLDLQAGEVRLSAALADSFADQTVANLINAVYPIKVAAVSPDGSVYVNRGADGQLRKESIMEVLRPGQQVFDPDTQVALGSMNSTIGRIELSNIEENRSIAKLIDGTGVQAGDLLKLIHTGKEEGTAIQEPHRTGSELPVSGPRRAEAVVGAEKVQTPGGKATLALAKIILNARQKFDDSSQLSAVQDGTMDQLTDNVVDALAKTNRFTLMERRQIDQVLDEKTFQSVSQGGDIREYLKELQGSDYLLIGELTNFYVRVEKNKVPYLDEIETKSTGFMEGNQRIVDSHTGKTIATEKVRVKKEFKKLGFEEVRTKLIDQYATETAAGIVDRIYQIKILAVQADGTIFINRGADAALSTGMTFSVERPGKELIDPDTNISFGFAESTIGSLQVTAVEPARARAAMVEGGPAAPGDILRNKKAPAKPQAKPKMQVSW